MLNSKNLAAQLYTVRSLCQTPQETAATLKQIKSIGFAAVEVAGICPIEAADLLKMTGDEGLEICSVHGDADSILADPQKGIQRLKELGIDYMVYSYPAGFDLTRAEDVRTMVGNLALSGAAFRAAGKTLCYHHHSLEFTRFGKVTVLEHILESIGPADLSLELDTYWIQHGGGTVVEWCDRLKNRLPILHMKDYGCIAGTPTMMEVGNGNLDWTKIIAAAGDSGCKWFVVEQDTCPGNPLDSLKISWEYLRSQMA
ncbi:MAG: sugar phosphate isomerase/epimerase [Verrucomicrobiota bacterium]